MKLYKSAESGCGSKAKIGADELAVLGIVWSVCRCTDPCRYKQFGGDHGFTRSVFNIEYIILNYHDKQL